MEEVSEILKSEMDEMIRGHGELRYALPILKRILKKLKVHERDERKDNERGADALILAMIIIENEIERMEGK